MTLESSISAGTRIKIEFGTEFSFMLRAIAVVKQLYSSYKYNSLVASISKTPRRFKKLFSRNEYSLNSL